MTTPDILETVGFEKRKVGSGDKELGYAITKSRLTSLLCGTAALVTVLGIAAILTLFEVHFERRSFHRQLRREEHHSVAKLAEVEMELWAQYRDDILESKEALSAMRSFNTTFDDLQRQIQATVDASAKELNMNKDKASHLANKVLGLVASMRQSTQEKQKFLMNHLLTEGKRSAALEKHIQKEIEEKVSEEQKLVQEDAQAGDADIIKEQDKEHDASGTGGNNITHKSTGDEDEDEDEDPLKAMIEGFWYTFNDYEGEFGPTTRGKISAEGNLVHKELTELYNGIHSETPPSENEIMARLGRIDLSTVDIGLGSGRVLPAEDIVEELMLIPKVPHVELKALEKAWRSGEKDTFAVASELIEYHRKGLVPSGWWSKGVEKEELEEEREEEEEEHKEEAQEEKGGKA